MLQKTFSKLGLSSATHTVYMRLLEKGSCSAHQLADWTDLRRTSVYDHLKVLIQKGLVVERYDQGKRIFSVDDPQNLPKLLDENIESLKKEREMVASLIPTLLNGGNALEPKMKFYSGIEGVRHVLNDFKWQHNVETLSMWPIKEMIGILGSDFFEDLNKRRIKQNVSIRGIWPLGRGADIKAHPYMGTGKEFLREIREAPRHMKWDMGYWIYADKVAFISSSKEAFGFTIHSKEFCDLMKIQFESVWSQSKKIKPNHAYTDPWINKVYTTFGKQIPR